MNKVQGVSDERATTSDAGIRWAARASRCLASAAERVVHAKGTPPTGSSRSPRSLPFHRGGLFQPGAKTPLSCASRRGRRLGSPHTPRPTRLRDQFYTRKATTNWSATTPGSSSATPPILRPLYLQKRLPDTGMRSNEMQWAWTLSRRAPTRDDPDVRRGTPRTLRHMNGYGSHTFSWANAGGEKFWVKYHFKTAQGIENYTEAEALAIAAEDPDAHRRDLRAAIAAGDAPEWRLEVQIMPFEEADSYRFNPFDLTKSGRTRLPPIPVGRLVLDRNPTLLQRSSIRVSPANWSRGRPQSRRDAVGRIFTTRHALHRIGANYDSCDHSPLAPADASARPPRRRSVGRPARSATTRGPARRDDNFGRPARLPRGHGQGERASLVENLVPTPATTSPPSPDRVVVLDPGRFRARPARGRRSRGGRAGR